MNKTIISILMIAGMMQLNAQQNSKKDSIKQHSIKEVIITSSYGTKKMKEEVVGAITSLSSKDIDISQPFESLDKMLQGLAPGLQIVDNTELGKPVNINIRGLGSMVSLSNRVGGTSTQPLIIIDGVIMREDLPFDAIGFNGSADSEMNINPLARLSIDNIESVNILKDAAAVALYGADAANGVILINMKKGKKGRMVLSLSSQYGVSTSINKMKYLSGSQYAEVMNAYSLNTGGKGYTWNGVDVDWFDVMNRRGSYFKTNFTASGGFKYFNYRFGVDYSDNQESKIMNNLVKRGIDATLGVDYKKLKASLYMAYNDIDKNQPNTYFNFILAPVIPVYNSKGEFNDTGYNNIPNPLAAAKQNIANVGNKSFLSSLNVNYQINKNFKISSVFGLDLSDKVETKWKSGLNNSGRFNGTSTAPDGTKYNRWGRSILNYSDGLKWNWSLQMYYQKTIADSHNIDVLLGGEIRSNKDIKKQHNGSTFVNYSEYQLPWEALVYISNDKQTQNYTYRQLTNKDAGRSVFGQINYDFDKKYFLSATLRRDESSAFGKDVNAAYNGAIGVSWVISKERFMQNQEIVSFLRMRTSWGMTGNSRIGSYRSSGLYNIYQNGNIYGDQYATPDTSSPPVGNLSWEKNEKYNMGLDFDLFNGKANFTLEAYRNNISDMIVSRDAVWESGYTNAEINGAEMYNQGIEFSANAKWFSGKKFRWNTTFNIGTVSNKITAMKGFGESYSIAAYARAQKIGTSTSAIWGYRYLGVNPTTGRYQYLVNGDVREETFTSKSSEYEIIGDTQPDAIGGLRNVIGYKNFNLSFNLTFEIGGDELLSNEYIDKFNILLNRNTSVNALDYWSPVNSNADIHKPDRVVPKSNTSKYVYDKTNIKLRNINLSYKLPLKKEKSSFLKDANIFVDITNVLYWYKEKSPIGRNGIREMRYLYPEMRTWSIGFRVGF